MSSISQNVDSASLQNHYAKAYRDLEEAKDTEIKRNQKQHQQDLKDLDKSYQNALTKKDQETDRIVGDIREKSAESLIKDQERSRETIEQLQKDSYNSRGQLASAIPFNEHQKRMDTLTTESEKRHQTDLANAELNEQGLKQTVREVRSQADADIRKQHEMTDARLATQSENMRNRIIEEDHTTDQRVTDINREMQKSDKTHQGELKRVTDAYNNNLDRINRNLSEKDHDYQESLRNNLQEKDNFLASSLNKTNDDHRRNLKDLEKVYATQIEQLDKNKKQSDQAAADHLQATVQADHDLLETSLTDQSTRYQIDQQKQSELEASRYRTLENQYTIKAHPTSVNDVPPDLENKIRTGIIQNYEKSFNTEVDRNKINQEKLAEMYGSNYRKALEETSNRETQFRQQSELERARERNMFFDTLSTTQSEAQVRSREQDANYQVQLDKIQRKFAYALERQKQEYNSIIDGMRSDADLKMAQTREDGARESKLTLKAINEKHSEILRDYDKRMSEQREQYEYLIEDLKTQAKSENREVERRSKQELETQAKMYDQKLAQVEEQNKEHERYLAQGYQEQLEKLRRSYEVTNQQKKS